MRSITSTSKSFSTCERPSNAAGVPEYDINKVRINQKVNLELVTGQQISGKLTFVSKSASPDTRTFIVESQIENPQGLVKDGLTANMTIKIDKVNQNNLFGKIDTNSDMRAA